MKSLPGSTACSASRALSADSVILTDESKSLTWVRSAAACVSDSNREQGTRCAGTHRGGTHAGKGYVGAGSKEGARRQVTFDSGRRIRPRRIRTYSRRQAWSEVGKAGHRHRTVEGTARRRETPRAEGSISQGSSPGETRFGQGTIVGGITTVSQTIPRNHAGSSEGREASCISRRDLSPGPSKRSSPRTGGTQPRGSKGGSHQGNRGHEEGRAEGCAHTRRTQGVNPCRATWQNHLRARSRPNDFEWFPFGVDLSSERPVHQGRCYCREISRFEEDLVERTRIGNELARSPSLTATADRKRLTDLSPQSPASRHSRNHVAPGSPVSGS